MRRILQFLLVVASGAVPLGCSETGLDLIHAERTGVSGSSSSGAGGDDVDAGGTLPEAGELPMGCGVSLSAVAPGQVRIRQVSSGLCLAQGGATTVGMEPAFEVLLDVCTSDTTQLWELSFADPETYAVKNVAAADNLDMQYASTADGTPAVLFRPHQLYNQRFYFRPLDDGTFWLTPRSAVNKCLSERLPGVELWPCANGDLTQSFQVFDGACW